MQSRGAVLALNTFAFAVCFSVWVLFGVAAIPIASQLGLDPARAGLLMSTPIFLGAVLRLPVGVLVNRHGARVVFPVLMAGGALFTYLAGDATSFPAYLATGFALGLVGASFAVGVFAVSTWFPPEQRGEALGIFGAGNLGTAVTALGAPYLVAGYGLAVTFRVYAVVLAITAVLYAILMRDAPGATSAPASLARALLPLREVRTWRFGLYYLVTFGGFVALSLKLPSVYRGVYGVSVTRAGLLAAGFGALASLIRAPGGGFSDRFGARATLRVCVIAIAILSGLLGLVPMPLPAFMTLVLLCGAAMGIGSAASFKYVAEFFPWDVGTVGGLVGAIGGLGGFVLPPLSGLIERATGRPTSGMLALTGLAVFTLVVQRTVVRRIEEMDRQVVALQEEVPASGGTSFEARTGTVGQRVIAIRGRLDEASAGEFAALAKGELAGGCRELVIDLAGCVMLASAGINAFLLVHREVLKLGGAFSFASPTPAVAQILEICGFARVVPICY